jgi:AraC-like DNA-binding protein
MEDYNKIIESLGVKYIKSRSIRVLAPVTIDNYYDVSNTLIVLHKGEISFGPDKLVVSEGDLLFIPAARQMSITYGHNTANTRMTNEDMLNNRDKFLSSIKDAAQVGVEENSFSYLTFEAKVFDSVNFYASLDIPPFILTGKNTHLGQMITETVTEELSNFPGRDRLIKINAERVAVEVMRYIINHNLFVEQLATNITYFKDPRLLDIFAYIKNNLGGDLSNKVLAGVANVSEDYVGQYFKMLTGINPQDYIEYQRMEMAVNLLRTSKKSIREIGAEVGYKDTAYFCRRFKMMFGIPAGKMRRRESLMNI